MGTDIHANSSYELLEIRFQNLMSNTIKNRFRIRVLKQLKRFENISLYVDLIFIWSQWQLSNKLSQKNYI